MRRRLLTLVPARAVVGFGLGLVVGAALSVLPAERVEEDSPLWDCASMGNQQCGPDAELPWWTTSVCPAGIEAPCLDNTVSWFEVTEYNR